MKLPALSIKVLTVQEIKNLRAELFQARHNLEDTLLGFATDIYKVWYFKYWQDWGFKNFANYCAEELGIGHTWANNYRILGHLLLAKKITIEEIKRVGLEAATLPYLLTQKVIPDKKKGYPVDWMEKDEENPDLTDKNANKMPTGLRNHLKFEPEVLERNKEVPEPDFSALPAIIFPPDRRKDYDHMVEVLEVASRFAGVHWRVSPWRVLMVLADVFWAEYCLAGPGMSSPPSQDEGWWEAALDRDGWACVKCSRYWPLQVDHIKPRSLGGTNDLENLQTLCSPCHQIKHQGERK